MTKPQRVIIASNRLPVVVNPDGLSIDAAPASGGLATGLRAFHEAGDSLWVGWSGELAADAPAAAPFAAELARRRIVGVTLARDTARQFYDGMCNAVLWPLFHSNAERMPLDSDDWEAYRAVNERFAAAIAREYRPGDAVWIHDYHLLLVPRLLRTLLPEAAIGFFLHVPFPAPDVFRALPWRRELLEGVLGATVVGFHTSGYANHFLDAVKTLLPRESAATPTPHVGAYPMGINVAAFSAAAAPTGREDAARDGLHVLLGVDRLDYTKGIPQRLLAYDRLIRNRPDLRGRVRLVQLAVPSRETVPSYRALRKQVEELVGRINGEHGTADWTPIHYIRRSISPGELVALYRQARVMLVTPVRDGMNLVAKEFVASRVDGDGVLVLSEFAGAAEQLRGALTVNPYSIDQMAATMATALAMDTSDRRRRMAALRARVIEQDVRWWSERFLGDLRRHAAPKRAAEPARSRAFWPLAMVRARLSPWGRKPTAKTDGQPRTVAS